MRRTGAEQTGRPSGAEYQGNPETAERLGQPERPKGRNRSWRTSRGKEAFVREQRVDPTDEDGTA